MKTVNYRFLISLILILVFCLNLPAKGTTALAGKVVAVKDGDTIVILKNKTQFTIRLNGIDCPEKKQAYGQAAKQFASDRCFGKQVKVISTGKDRYQRYLGEVFLPGGKSLNQELLKAGLAWHYKQYSKDKYLAKLENSARQAKAGLWRDKNPIPPWEFRRKRK